MILPSWGPGNTRDAIVGFTTRRGTEFVRWVSKRWYGVEPGMVVGRSSATSLTTTTRRREFVYESTAATSEDAEPTVDVAYRLGWVVVSMKEDWEMVFPD